MCRSKANGGRRCEYVSPEVASARLHRALETGDEQVKFTATLPREVAQKVLTLLSEERLDGAIVVPAAREFRSTEAAAILGVSRSHLSRLINDGKIAARKVGAHWRVPAAAIVAFQDAERAEALARMDEFMAAVNEMDDEHRAAVRGQDPPCACDVCT